MTVPAARVRLAAYGPGRGGGGGSWRGRGVSMPAATAMSGPRKKAMAAPVRSNMWPSERL